MNDTSTKNFQEIAYFILPSACFYQTKYVCSFTLPGNTFDKSLTSVEKKVLAINTINTF